MFFIDACFVNIFECQIKIFETLEKIQPKTSYVLFFVRGIFFFFFFFFFFITEFFVNNLKLGNSQPGTHKSMA